MYDIDFRNLLLLLLPPFLRKDKRYFLLDVALYPLRTIYSVYQETRDRYFRLIRYNSVEAVLEMALYEEFSLGEQCQAYLQKLEAKAEELREQLEAEENEELKTKLAEIEQFKFFRIDTNELYHYIYRKNEAKPRRYIYSESELNAGLFYLYPYVEGRPEGFYDFTVQINALDLMCEDYKTKHIDSTRISSDQIKKDDLLKMINEFVWNYRLSGKKYNLVEKIDVSLL